MTTEQTKALASRIAADLFTNGMSRTGTRLVVVKEEPGKTAKVSNADDLGGWCEAAVRKVIAEHLRGGEE